MGEENERDLILPGKKVNQPVLKGNKDSLVPHVLNLKDHITSNDPRAQSTFVNMVKKACLEFKRSPIDFDKNKIDQKEVIDLTQDILMGI